nr:unnamed protein product [Callosobruchus analis]
MNEKYSMLEKKSGYKTVMLLTVHNITKGDFGTYTCIAQNTMGKSEDSVRLYEIRLTTTSTTTTTTSTTTTPSTTTTTETNLILVLRNLLLPLSMDMWKNVRRRPDGELAVPECGSRAFGARDHFQLPKDRRPPD